MDRRLLLASLLASLSILASRTRGSTVPTTGPFLAYKTKPTKHAAKFQPVANVHLVDAFEDLSFDVKAAGDLLLPADVNGGGIGDPDTHLRAYKIKAVKGSAHHVKRLRLPVSTSLGTLVIDTTKPDLLLVPTAKSLVAPPAPPDDGVHAVDHYKCYAVKLSKGATKLPKHLQLAVADQFTVPARLVDVVALKHLCVSVDQDAGGVKNPNAALACYSAKVAKSQPKHVPRHGVLVNNELGPLTLATVKESEVCLPSTLAVPTPTPGTTSQGGQTATPTPTSLASGGATPSTTATSGGTPLPTPTSTALPPDPGTVAPPPDAGVASLVGDDTSFLYTGANPIQTGVAAGTIDRRRAAVVRGRVLAANGAPLPGVRIRVLAHVELGETRSRADGGFDLAVNGGGLLTIDYSRDGLLPAQRQTQVPWNDFVTMPDVTLIPLDAHVTTVDLTANDPIQVARGGVMSDADGGRQATLLFPQGTQADMVMPDGSTHPMTALGVRATEYTVGPGGPAAMPGELPPASGYTYAVELSADEAMAAGATEVRFSQPVIQYLENFLGLDVGTLVPAGFYDRVHAMWVAADDGRVVGIVSVTAGAADLDVDGDGVADVGAALAALGITDAERQKLATLYAPGQSLWRVPIPHFSPWDFNYPYGPPPDSCAPGDPGCGDDPPPGPEPDDQPQPNDDPCGKQGASTIACQTQALGEAVAVTGTDFTLRYSSDRELGRRSARTMHVNLIGTTVPPNLQAVHLEIHVAGQVITKTLAPAANLVDTFTWDGKDVYGRVVQGKQPVTVRIGYEYVAQYYTTKDSFAASFNRFGSPPVASGGGGGGAVSFSRVLSRPSTPPIILWRDYRTSLGFLDARELSFGAWNLNVQQAYDPVGHVLYQGNGRRRESSSISSQIANAAGGGHPNFGNGDGGPATQARVDFPAGIAIAPDGTLYFSDPSGTDVINNFGNDTVRRVAPNGIISTVAGGGHDDSDGIPATTSTLFRPAGLALGSDGSLYIADTNHHRIRRVRPDGIIVTVAGTGTSGFSGDDGPATAAELSSPVGVAMAPDGTLYVADTNNNRVRRVAPDGIITTIAGTGASGFAGDGGSAALAKLSLPRDVKVGSDGTLYIADGFNFRVRRISTDGVITTVAGNGTAICQNACGDGGPAVAANLDIRRSGGLALADGGFYVADGDHHRVRFVDAAGNIRTVAGNGVAGCAAFGNVGCGDGGPSAAAGLSRPVAVGSAPDGSLYVADHLNLRVRRVAPALPGVTTAGAVIPSEDGRALYAFDASGRHLRTLDALTGVVLYELGYDAGKRLISVTDRSGNTTLVERAAGGAATALVAPGGQRTDLTVSVAGYLTQITNPANEAVHLTYAGGTAEGLLLSYIDPRGGVHQYAYDASGRLAHDQDPAGGFTDVAVVDTNDTRTTTLTSALGRTTTYLVDVKAGASEHQVVTFPDGSQNDVLGTAKGARTLTRRDGLVIVSSQGPDPRFGMQAPFANSLTVTTPAHHVRTTTRTRTATLQSSTDLLSLVTATDTTTTNGQNHTRVYDAASRTATMTTPVGRTVTSTVDAKGRITQIAAQGLAPLQFAYDAHGQVVSLTQAGRVYAFTYDGAHRLTQLTDPLGHTDGRRLQCGRPPDDGDRSER